MTLQQLSYFVAVYRYGSFTTAADELYISQSSVSKSIISLERELSADLFVRNTRRVKLSRMGNCLLPRAIRIVKEYEDMLRFAENSRRSGGYSLRVGGVPVLSVYGLTKAILQFETAYPEFTTEISEIRTEKILEGISSHTLDVGIVRLRLPDSQEFKGMRIVPLLEDEQVLVVPKGSPLADQGRLPLSEARGQTFVQLNSDPVMSKYHIDQIQASLPDASIHLVNAKLDTVQQYILQRGWVSLVMGRVAQENFEPETSIVPLTDALRLSLCAVLRSDETRVGPRSLVRFLKARFDKPETTGNGDV